MFSSCLLCRADPKPQGKSPPVSGWNSPKISQLPKILSQSPKNLLISNPIAKVQFPKSKKYPTWKVRCPKIGWNWSISVRYHYHWVPLREVDVVFFGIHVFLLSSGQFRLWIYPFVLKLLSAEICNLGPNQHFPGIFISSIIMSLPPRQHNDQQQVFLRQANILRKNLTDWDGVLLCRGYRNQVVLV